jgi:hypothetical protein
VKGNRLVRTGLAACFVLVLAAQGFAAAQSVQNRIPQQVIINGQRVSGAHVTAPNGGMQTFTCPDPQQYATPEGASQGWACFDQATGVWLLNALPPAPQPVQQAPVPVPQQPPTVVYQQPPAVIYQQPVPATVIYTSPAPVVVAPAYRPAVVLGAAAINATGRIVRAAILHSGYPRGYYYYYARPGHRRW